MLTPARFLQWHFGIYHQADSCSGWCFVAHKEALSGTNTTQREQGQPSSLEERALTHFWVSAELCLLHQPYRDFTTRGKGTSACDTEFFIVVNFHGCSQPQASMAQICCLLVIPGQAMSGLDLQVYSNSINKEPTFISCQRKEPGRLQLVLILAHICRRDLSFQPRNLACMSVTFYRRHEIDYNPCDTTVLFKPI